MSKFAGFECDDASVTRAREFILKLVTQFLLFQEDRFNDC